MKALAEASYFNFRVEFFNDLPVDEDTVGIAGNELPCLHLHLMGRTEEDEAAMCIFGEGVCEGVQLFYTVHRSTLMSIVYAEMYACHVFGGSSQKT